MTKPLTTEAFEALSPAKQRVLIAQDVIAQLRAGNLRLTAGDYLASAGFCPLASSGSSAKDHMNEVMASCTVCAKGALFLSHIGRTNEISVREVMISGCEDMTDRLVGGGVFSQAQWDLIECAFERALFGVYDDVDGSDDERLDADERHMRRKGVQAMQFGARYRPVDYHDSDARAKANRRRLTAIMLNIIANHGTFKPSDIESSRPAEVTAALKPSKAKVRVPA